LNQVVSVPKEFIIPGDTPSGAFLDLTRSVARRAERRVAALLHGGQIENTDLLRYLNRLSSLCFILELRETQSLGKTGPTLARHNLEDG
jgi:cob(I)alamin adenosyltransferase